MCFLSGDCEPIIPVGDITSRRSEWAQHDSQQLLAFYFVHVLGILLDFDDMFVGLYICMFNCLCAFTFSITEF